MRIAYIYDAVYPFVKGGVERRVYEIGRRLARKYEVHWYGLDWGGKPEEIIFHPVGKWESLYSNGRRSIMEAVYFALKLISKIKGKYDIIDCQQFPYLSCFPARVYALKIKIPLVITWHEFWGDYWLKYLGTAGVFGRFVEHATKTLGDANISVSRLTQRILGIQGVRSRFIPNGVDYWGIQNVQPHWKNYDVVFVGRLIPEKNVQLLLESLSLLRKEISDLQAVIIGDGPEKVRLQTLCRKLDLERNVTFKGFLESHTEVISYMKAAKVLVLPSQREGFGITALEANAAGIPVVTVDYPMNAVRDLVISGYNGFISGPSRESLAESILWAIYSKKKMKRNCIQNAKKYDWDIIANLTENFYEVVLDDY